jgi:hypothetical protein
MRQTPNITPHNLFDPDHLELSLLSLTQEAWQSVDKPTIIKRDDDTYVTGDPFFDEFEEALSQGENIDGILERLKLSST